MSRRDVEPTTPSASTAPTPRGLIARFFQMLFPTCSAQAWQGNITAICFLLFAAFPSAQSGGGELSPTVVETVEAHEGTLDLLVLWRGKAGWFNTRPSQAGANQSFIEAGGSDRIHRVSVHGRTLELRVDAKTNTAHIQNQMIPLQGVNVLLIDEVDQTSIRVAGTLWVDPKLLSFNPWSREDPVTAIIKQSPLLTDYVKH